MLLRGVETELFPCLRKFGISFYEFNPRTRFVKLFTLGVELIHCASVGGGFFTGRYTSANAETEPGSRFDPARRQGAVSYTVNSTVNLYQ